MKTATPGRALIKGYEKLRMTAYLCASGKPTIGWGSTRGVRLGMSCTLSEAEARFSSDLAEAEAAVNAVPVKFSQNQFDALVSLVFNIGVTNFATSTLRKCLRSGNYAGAAEQFPAWKYGTVKGKKVVLAGLVERRAKERELFIAN